MTGVGLASMGGLSLLFGDSGGLPLVAGSYGEQGAAGGSDRISGLIAVTPCGMLI
jgi:hypothetical protein